MGFLDNVLGMVGIGQPKVALTVDVAKAGLGGLLTCTVSAEGGRRPLPVDAFSVKLVQRKVVKTEQGTRTDRDTLFEETAPMGGAVIQPGKSMGWSCVIQVPVTAPPSDATHSYVVEASLSCPGWDPSAEQPLVVSSDRDPAAAEDLARHFVLPEARQFRHSSVHGDYRVLLCDGGFVTTWKDLISVRNRDGSQRCRIPGWGKSIAVSPDGKQLAASNASKQVAVFDLATGSMVGDALAPGEWIFDVVFTADGTLLASTSDKVFVYGAGGALAATLTDLRGPFYVGGLAAARDGGFYLTDANGGRLIHAAVSGAVVSEVALRNPSALFASDAGTWLAVECSDRVAIVNAALEAPKVWRLPGKDGVRYIGQSEHSYTHFKAMPHLSPDGKTVLVQDGSGALWRVNVDGTPVQVFPRAVLDYVEDVAWLSDTSFLAVTNGGRVRQVALDGAVAFDHADADAS